MIFEIVDIHGNVVRFDESGEGGSADAEWSDEFTEGIMNALWDGNEDGNVIPLNTEITIRRVG